MKLPEPLFLVINPAIRLVLRSPLHAILSNSLMLITYQGRKSRKRFTTPVRYIVVDGKIRCFTSQETMWWRNLRGGADVTLRIQGQDKRYHAVAIVNDPRRIGSAMLHYLDAFPQDAAYYGIKLNRDKSWSTEGLDEAIRDAVVVEATPL